MSSEHLGGAALALFLLASAGVATAAIVVAVKRSPGASSPEPEPIPVALVARPAEPIAAEAQVFRTSPEMLAIAPEARRERAAHPRNLQTFRYLRAYPGAPPRIPHALTPLEFRTGTCTACHEHGGYSRRFAAYVPVTPHAERGTCLQCHVGDGAVPVVARPNSDPNRRCPQCHGSGGSPRADAELGLDWQTTLWPKLARRAPERTPPPIPHDLQSRGNCLPCHAGPAAVAEIRTGHPERVDCRQCHLVPERDAAEFTRPAALAGREAP
jgi:cytochrome c-type protein NapB